MGAATVATMAARVRAGEVEPGRYVAEALDRCRDGDTVNAFLALAPDVSEPVAAGGPLAGVPVAVKDNLATVELPTTCGSRMLDGYVSPFDATAIRRLRDAGAVVIGKTNLDEFAMGSSTENSAFGPTLHPEDPTRVPGGSSGGSAAAVALGLVPGALGSDTGGSIRQPAAFCGIVGIKPTYGRVSRYGLVAFASSLDQVGTLGRTVEDATLLLDAIGGHDPRDATSAHRGTEPLAPALADGVEGLTVGVPLEYFPESLDAGIRQRCDHALETLRAAGARVAECSLPSTGLAIPSYYLIAPAEASSNLARFDGLRYGTRVAETRSTREMVEASRSHGFGEEVKRRIMLGTYALSAGYYDAYYGRATRARARIAAEFREAFAHLDVLFTPTSPTVAFPLGERVRDPVAMYLSDVFTAPASLAGLPAVSVPIGRSGGLPVGGQLLAPPWQEARMLRVAWTLERELGSVP